MLPGWSYDQFVDLPKPPQVQVDKTEKEADATTVVVDNSANTHIWNVLEDFDNYVALNPEDLPGVTTIN